MGEVHGKLVFFLILVKLEFFLIEIRQKGGESLENYIKAGKDF